MNIEIIIENKDWNSRKINKLIKDTTKAVFSYLKLESDDIGISVLCTNDEEIRVLNKTYRGVDSATNVLSFPMESDLEYDDFDYDEFDFEEGGLSDLDVEVSENKECDCECHCCDGCSDTDLENNKCDCGEECHCDKWFDSDCDCCENYSDDGCVLGCTAFAYETIDRESKEQGKSFDDHMKHLVVHSVLHLLGYDHVQNEEAEKMEDLEIKILKTLGVNNPYQEKE